MMNLSSQEKKLFFNAAKVLGGILIIGLMYYGISSLNSYFKNKKLEERKQIIEKYENKNDSIKRINLTLTNKIDILNSQIDSLKEVKNKIYWKYGNDKQKINVIYDASAIDHAKWVDTILIKLDSLKK